MTSSSKPIESSADIEVLRGGCAVAGGFRFAGVHCGIKRSRPDLALIVADEPATVAGVFTSNRVQAACVRHGRALLSAGTTARAVVINSGNANACTGKQGHRDNGEMAELVAAGIGCDPRHVFVSSTGVIGRALPMASVRAGVSAAVEALATGDEAGARAAEAILTTDTGSKAAAYRVRLSTGTVNLGGIAKGSGMIAPDLQSPKLPHATTLAYLTTDAVVSGELLQSLLQGAMDQSFNCITVDGDTSTNDTVLLLASGASTHGLATDGDREIFAQALLRLALDLALMVVKDGEGAQRLIEVRVSGARSQGDARKVARTVAESPLVKTAFCAGEPNWGRFLMAVGRSGAEVVEEQISIRVNDLSVVEGGLGTDHDPQALRSEMIRDEVQLAIHLGAPENGAASCWTCDLSEEYVRINGHYLT